MLEAKIQNGKEIVPGTHIYVSTLPLRYWGGRPVTNMKAEPVEAKGVVLSVTFENGEADIEWTFEALVEVPIFEKDGTLIQHAQRILNLKPENCIDVLQEEEQKEE